MFGLQNYMYQPSIPNFPFIVWKWVTCPQPHVLHCLGERTHQIPVEGLAKRDDSYRKIWLDLLRFVNPEQTPIFPPVYCRVSLVNYSWKLINEKDGCLVSQTLTCSLNVVNPLHLNISMCFLPTVLYTFPSILTMGICWKIKSFFVWISFPLLPWPWFVIQGWYYKEKLDAFHPKAGHKINIFFWQPLGS